MEDKRESLIFYRSFYEAIKELELSKQGEIYNAIFNYGLNFKEPQLEGISKTVFTLIKPQLEANIKKYNNGKKPKSKQTRSKSEANSKQKGSKREGNVNDNVNNNEKENGNDNIEQFKNFIKENGNNNLTSILLQKLFELGYEPSKEETVETFREWFAGLGIPASKCKQVIDNFYEYWKFEKENGKIKKKKNWKLTFSNNPLLKDVTTS